VTESLVGRGPELSTLAEWVNDLVQGHGRAALVEGEPGIGKSTLLRAALKAAASRGCAAFWGAGDELGQAFPLLPLLEAFVVRESSPDPWRAAVAQALRAGSTGAGPGVVPAAVEGLLALIDHVSTAQPILLVVDDMHWADSATVSVWHQLARTANQRAVLLLGALRPLPRGEELADLRASVGPDSLLRLEPLDAPAVAELVATLAGGRPGPELTRLAEDAAGNPLYLTDLVDALVRGNAVTVKGGVAESTGGPAPRTLTEAIVDRLHFLSDEARDVVEAAALLGGDISVDELSLVLQRDTRHLRPALLEALADGVLLETGGNLKFRHPLIRQALYDDLPVSARAAWHRAVARALWADHAPAERVALHLLPAVRHDERVGGWELDWLAGAAPMLVGMAPEAARTLLLPAVRQLPDADDRKHALAAQLARAAAYQDDLKQVEQVIIAALPHVRESDVLVDLLDTMHTARGLRRVRQEDTMARLERAMARPGLPPAAGRRLRVMLAKVRYTVGHIEGAEQLARDVLAAGDTAQDPWASAWAANMLGAMQMRRGELQAAREVVRLGREVTEGEPDLTDVGLTLLCLHGEVMKHLDRVQESQAMFTEAGRLAERIGNLPRIAWVQSSLAELFWETGQWDEALVQAEQYLTGEHSPMTDANANSVVALIALHRGDLQRGKQRLAAGLRAAEYLAAHEIGFWVSARALERVIAGVPGAALATLRGALGRGLSEQRIDVEAEYLLAPTVRLAVELGDKETAGAVTARAEALAADGSLPRRRSAALHCRGWLDADHLKLLDAAECYRDAGRPLARAEALEAAALVLAESGDVAAARAPFLEAHAVYAALGADWDVDRLQTTFRPFGLRLGWTVRKATIGWEALTAAEVRVAELVAEGLSNTEVGELLAVSRRTVETHVGNSLAKLQARSRIDIARVVVDRRRAGLAR
jgi:DNA-binding CsgD family transcriptional regulator